MEGGVGSSWGNWTRYPSFQRGPRTAVLSALASPTRPEDGASRTCLCIRWGCRGLRAIHQVRFGVSSPSPLKVCSLCKVPFRFFYS